jgi:hypothetical protein
MIEHCLETDVVVVGGGMAGVCAALAAARNGAKVVLVQDRTVLGGNASSEVRMHICGADESGGRPGWRESGIIDEIRLEEAVRNPQRSAGFFDLLLYEKVVNEPNIKLLLDTACCGVEMQGKDRIAAAVARSEQTEDIFRIRAPVFCDCSGDGRLGSEAGAEFRVGREARSEFGESFAPDQADRKVLGSTILFTARRHDRPMPFQAPSWARKFTEADLKRRGHSRFEYGYWWIEWGGDLDTIKDNREIRHELLRIALGVWDHIKNGGDHHAENWALEWVGMLPGKRESRRFVGEHILRQQDLQEPVLFDDRVAYGGWSIDLHPSEGVDRPDLPACEQHRLAHPYSIPLRSLCSRNVRNLMFAGRNISATHVAFGSTRVMATCAVMGQAIGTAGAVAACQSLLPGQIVLDAAVLKQLQQTLLRDDQTILACRNEDPADLARSARATASSEQPDAPAVNVINGVTRAVGKDANEWRSQPIRGSEYVELAWPAAQQIGRVQLVFDTGFGRPLTLSHDDGYTQRMIRGPQPETVRDYEVQVHDAGDWRAVVKIADNYQRRRVHRFQAVRTNGLRVVVRRTNGEASARVFEIRAYGS